MVSGTRDNPPPRYNFTERLYENVNWTPSPASWDREARLHFRQNDGPHESSYQHYVSTFNSDRSTVNGCWYFHGATFAVEEPTGTTDSSRHIETEWVCKPCQTKLDYTKKGSGLLAETGEDRSVVDKHVAGTTCRGGMGSKYVNK